MQAQEGKFVLFFDAFQFAAWLDSSSFSRVIRLLQCHHTYIPSYANFRQTNHFELLRAMEIAHLQRGFAEIAQNLTTFPDGSVAVCRPIDTVPAGIKGANTNGICIENLGNFDIGQDSMTPKHRDCIINVHALLCKRFNLQPDSQSIVFHHWYDLSSDERTNAGNTKSCPGTNFFGGNSVEVAEQNFIRLIDQQLGVYSGSGPSVQLRPLYTANVEVERLNVRAQPSVTVAIVKQLNRGVELSVYEESGGWCRVDPVNSLWVDGQFLAPTSTTVQVQALYVAQVTAEQLNVRTRPSLSSTITNQLSRGTNIYVYEERDNWCRIDSASPLWVSGNYLGRLYAAVPLQ